jgi:4-amino-4-deoxy-L-arabinose transferase-like glycosyltransferase
MFLISNCLPIMTISPKILDCFFLGFIVLYFFYGLLNIDAPPIDKDAWRQTLTISMAKEYIVQSDIRFPRTIIGVDSDILAAECPIYSYILSKIYFIFGYQDWYGRLLNWFVFFIGLTSFYSFGKNYFHKTTIQLAALSLLASIAANYARMSMPDVFSFSVMMYGVLLLNKYLLSGKNIFIFFGVLMCAIAGLNKIPFLMMTSLLIIPILNSEVPKRYKTSVVIGLILAIFPIAAWYFYWVPHLLHTYKNQLFWSYGLQQGFRLFYSKIDSFFLLLFKNTFHNVLLFLISLFGIYKTTKADKHVKYTFLVFFFLFLIFGIKTGTVLPTHEYYFIPIVPLFAIGIGEAFRFFISKNKYTVFIFFILLLPGFYKNHKDSYMKTYQDYFQSLPTIANNYIPENSKIIVNNGANNPSMMFWTNRKGMTVDNIDFQKSEWKYDLKKKGVLYAVQDKHRLSVKLTYAVVYEDLNFIVYRL